MINDKVEFMGRLYGLRVLDFGEEFGTLSVASHRLNARLLDESGAFTSEEAEILDEQIFYFIAPSEFALSDDVLATKILREIK